MAARASQAPVPPDEWGVASRPFAMGDLRRVAASKTVTGMRRLVDELTSRGLRVTCTGHLDLSNLEDGSGHYLYTAYNMRVWEYSSVYDLCRLGPGARMLDAGGASSIIDFYAASQGVEVATIDLQEALVENAKRTAGAMGWTNLVTERMDLSELRFPDASFDAVVSISVLEHLPDALKRRAMDEFARVVKPGGIVAVTFDFGEPVGGVTTYKYDVHDQTHSPVRTDGDIERFFLQTAGLRPLGGVREPARRIEVDRATIRLSHLWSVSREASLVRRAARRLRYVFWRRWVNPYFRYTFYRLVLERAGKPSAGR